VIRGVRVLPVLWEAPQFTTLGSCHYQGCSWVAIDPAPGRRGLRDVGPPGWMNGNSRSKMKKRSWPWWQSIFSWLVGNRSQHGFICFFFESYKTVFFYQLIGTFG